MPKLPEIKKVLVIGSGPIVIGQAAEFDYAGAQACLSLKEEGVEVVLVNNNPATIMTDEQLADKVYLEPLTVDAVAQIIAKERPDGLLPTLGGQTGLNLAVALSEAGVLARYQVKLLGTPLEAIQNGEDREDTKSCKNGSRVMRRRAGGRRASLKGLDPAFARPMPGSRQCVRSSRKPGSRAWAPAFAGVTKSSTCR